MKLKKMIDKLRKCRICGNNNLEIVVDLGMQYLTGRFPKDKNENITMGPLELVQCNYDSGCGLVQLNHSYDLNEMYGESYGYRSGLNSGMVKHLQLKVKKILDMELLLDGDCVLDIGSNDGTSLNSYPPNKYRLIGIDPSSKKFQKYYNKGIDRVADFFSSTTFKKKYPDIYPKIITSFSMYYDLEDPVIFASDISSVLDIDGLWIFEQSYLPFMLNSNSFDTICHEHLEYYSLHQIKFILDKVDMHICDVEFNDVNGGSFSITASKMKGKHLEYFDLDKLLENEKNLGIHTGDAFRIFNNKVSIEKEKLIKFLREQKGKGKKVSGLGASTKGNVLLQYYGIDETLVENIAEVNPDKYSCFTPGSLIPIKSQNEVLNSNPDYLLVLPWHFRDFFLNMDELKGQKLIFPLPKFEIVSV
jgi:NDP-4-keto-2,6-dideoxyhexose 3-C-methyltransferase